MERSKDSLLIEGSIGKDLELLKMVYEMCRMNFCIDIDYEELFAIKPETSFEITVALENRMMRIEVVTALKGSSLVKLAYLKS